MTLKVKHIPWALPQLLGFFILVFPSPSCLSPPPIQNFLGMKCNIFLTIFYI
ncbi:hypothetical protein BDR06DRAFT_958735 [Suillus hirtellus]|nr:hypothetical protein BDR06DRAFT_958735 [Suillus hirtellus]